MCWGQNSSVPVTLRPGLPGAGGCGAGVRPELCALRARTYRDSEGSGPAVVQHGAVVGVLQGILD